MKTLPGAELLKRTTSKCPTCQMPAPAEVWKRRDAKDVESVWLTRECPIHGEAEACIASDARFYWLAQGKEENQCCGGVACSASEEGMPGLLGRNAAFPAGNEFEALSTCVALIEVVHSCNLACPTCYADSPQSGAVDAVPLEDLQQRIQGVVDRKGRIEILQLSGGEPTLHPRFFELLEWCHAHPGIDYILLNTNGVRMAHDADFAAQLGKTFRLGHFQLYLQFDGAQEAGQRPLRGADLRETRRLAIERCGEIGVPVTLAMTVTEENLPHLWEAVAFGVERPHIRGISFQPMFRSGRIPKKIPGATRLIGPKAQARSLNTADIILAAVDQSAGQLKYADFTPLPCGDPNCATIGYLIKTPGGLRSISDYLDFTRIQGFLHDRIRYSPEDLAQCGCESEPLGRLLHDLEIDAAHTFRLFIKPFMDAWTWDQDRIDRCCTHVIRPDGKLDSFCRYYGAKG